MEEMVEELQEQRNQLRQDAKRNIHKIQAENKRTYDRKRKKAPRYQKRVLKAIQRTQFGSGDKSGERASHGRSENDVGSLEQLLLYADEHYLAGKLPLGDHLGKVLHEVEEYHQRDVGPLRFHALQLKWTGNHRLWPQTITPPVRAVRPRTVWGNCNAHQGASTPVHSYHLSPKQTGIHPKHNLLPICDFLGTTVDAVADVPVLEGVQGKGAWI
ncbi:uncharacterized protein TNCV_1081081 [Trichonephila clavipes]|uniref:Uncharacterized protein n=1 Tax=Trichonephila clavipes TaxID=2585209 RepID=A0A8X6VAX7_TRICX|nr:uncharacterized protein TNCV_1081081 [Trichonephila clavipes]